MKHFLRFHKDPQGWQSLLCIRWSFVLLLLLLIGVGLMTLYSTTQGVVSGRLVKQGAYGIAGLISFVIIAITPLRFWYRATPWIYGFCVALLVFVSVKGHIGMGAQRWISLGFIKLQPSEFMKLALILAVARYFHGVSYPEYLGRSWILVAPALLIGPPVGLILLQPDLGTALLCVFICVGMAFLAGVAWHFFAIGGALICGIMPFLWSFLHDYQKKRVLIFLDPEQDPLGAGYHILQSKIALGAGGVWGRGFRQGTQGQLNFLPEKQTDFIFTMIGEEWGFVGALVLLGLFMMLFIYGIVLSLSSFSPFGRLVGLGVVLNIFFSFFINTAMVMGLLPVVGVPLPFVSYGGSALVMMCVSCGFMMNVAVHKYEILG